MIEIRFGGGDSRNPDEIKSHPNVMHTNNITQWMYFKDQWYHVTSSFWSVRLKNIFDECQSEEEQMLWFDMAREEHIIFNEEDLRIYG